MDEFPVYVCLGSMQCDGKKWLSYCVVCGEYKHFTIPSPVNPKKMSVPFLFEPEKVSLHVLMKELESNGGKINFEKPPYAGCGQKKDIILFYDDPTIDDICILENIRNYGGLPE